MCSDGVVPHENHNGCPRAPLEQSSKVLFFFTEILQIPNGMLQAIFLQTTAGSKTLALCYKQERKISIKGAVPFCLYETVRGSFFLHLAQSVCHLYLPHQ